MSILELLRLLVKQRLDAAAEDIFGLFDETKEEELSRQGRNKRQHKPFVRLYRPELLRLSVKQRLDAAAEDIFGLFDETKAEYEEELSRQRENERHHKLLDAVFNPKVRLYRSDVPTEWSPGLDKKDPELWISLTSSVDKIKTEVNEEDCGGPDPARNRNPDHHSQPSTEFCYDDWQEALSDSGPETEVSDGDRMETRTPESAVNALKCKEGLASDMALNTVKTSFSFVKCSPRFYYKGSLKKHMKCHFEKKSSRCSVRKKYAFRVKEKTTQTTVCSGEKPFVCGKIVKQQTKLQRHMRIHTGERPFSCNVCEKTFSQHRHLQRHRIIHTGEKPFGCNVCEKTFNQQRNLQRHMIIHTGEKPFSCNVCEKTFNQQTNLKRHLRVHTGEKPFGCDVCGKRFNLLSGLQRHSRVHTGEKPYRCDVCGKRFTHQYHQKTHMRLHSGEKPC